MSDLMSELNIKMMENRIKPEQSRIKPEQNRTKPEQNRIKPDPASNTFSEAQKKQYQDYVKSVTPTHNLWLQILKAFLCGGFICITGQLLLNYLTKTIGMDPEKSGSICSLLLILIGVLLTGFNLYSKIVKFGGAGALVPITGFANSVAAPAIEYKTEGQVFGVGCKIFTIAGPVILFGIFTSWVLGLLYYAIHYL